MTNKFTLPDFDDMINLANEIGRLKTELMLKEAFLEQLRADITTHVMGNSEFWGGDKPPSNAHIKDTFHIKGYDNESRALLLSFVERIAELSGELKARENVFRVYQNMIDVWRTQSANARYES